MSDCVAACQHFDGGELRHHKDCPHYPTSMTFYYENQIQLLQSRLNEAEGVVGFYANPDHYDAHKTWGKVCIIESDTEERFMWPIGKLKFGGRRARAYIEKYSPLLIPVVEVSKEELMKKCLEEK